MELIFIGDLYLNNIRNKELLADIKSSSKNCLLVGNIESPISDLGSISMPKYASLRSSPSTIDSLCHLDIAILGNNHFCDYGHQASIDTVNKLNEIGIKTTGYGSNIEEATKPVTINNGFHKVAILSFCCPSTNGWNDATFTTPGVAPLNLGLIRRKIEVLLKYNDTIIVYLHWGIENDHTVTQNQIWAARKIIDWGASAVIGTHGHVIQPFENYKGKNIFYGIGNAVFDDVTTTDWRIDGKCKINVLKQSDKNIESIAPIFSINRDNGKIVFKDFLSLKFMNNKIHVVSNNELTININTLNLTHFLYSFIRNFKINSFNMFEFKLFHNGNIYRCDYYDKPISKNALYKTLAFISYLLYIFKLKVLP